MQEHNWDEWGTYAEACAIAPLDRVTFRKWARRGWIRALQIGPPGQSKKTLYNLDDVRAMVRPIGRLSDEQRVAIAKRVANSPDPTDDQMDRLRSIVHAGEDTET